MSKVSGRPPHLCNVSLVKVVQQLYNFTHIDVNSVKSFPSYDDRNYYFRGVLGNDLCRSIRGKNCDSDYLVRAQNKEFIFKMFNTLHTSVEAVKGISAIWTHIQSKGFHYNEQLLTKQGDLTATLTAHDLSKFQVKPIDGADHQHLSFGVRLMTFIPGELFDKVDKNYLTPTLMYDVGAFVGKIDATLQDGFCNSTIEKRVSMDWDLANLLNVRQYLSVLDPTKRASAEKILDYFHVFIVPIMSSFTKGVIHGDPNGLNIILEKSASKDEYKVIGMIDFDDAIKTCKVFDLGMLLAYIMIENLDPIGYATPVEFTVPMVSGFVDEIPLSPQELDSLYYLVLGRCCQSGVLGTVSYQAEPWNDYLLTTPSKCWKLIDILLTLGKDKVDEVWGNAVTAT